MLAMLFQAHRCVGLCARCQRQCCSLTAIADLDAGTVVAIQWDLIFLSSVRAFVWLEHRLVSPSLRAGGGEPAHADA
eukprot:2713350-Alexandrium_andersonii.AAC.1